MKDDYVIDIKQLTKDFGSGNGIFDVNLQIKKGETLGYLGPNGAGKSTTLRHLMGFMKQDSGSCQILGKDCFLQAADLQKEIGYLAGEIAFFDDMRGDDYLTFMAELKKVNSTKRMKELIAYFDVKTNMKIKKMSKGMKQKLAIVVAFMHEPSILILDEPTSGLDPLMQGKFIDLLLEEKRKGTTILISSHIFEEIEKTCYRVAMIHHGRIVDLVDMEQLHKKNAQTLILTLANLEEAARLANEKALSVIEQKQEMISIRLKGDLQTILKTLSNYKIMHMEMKHRSLEEVFLQEYERGKEE